MEQVLRYRYHWTGEEAPRAPYFPPRTLPFSVCSPAGRIRMLPIQLA